MCISVLGFWPSQCTESTAVILGGRGNVIWRESEPSDPEPTGWMQWVVKKIRPSEVGSLNFHNNCLEWFLELPTPDCLIILLVHLVHFVQMYISTFWPKAHAQSKCVSRTHVLYWEVTSFEMVSEVIWRHSNTQAHFNLWEANPAHFLGRINENAHRIVSGSSCYLN